jgi:hypothetical protein
MKENIKNPLLVSRVTIPDLMRVESASKLLRLRRADYIRLVVLQKTNEILDPNLSEELNNEPLENEKSI